MKKQLLLILMMGLAGSGLRGAVAAAGQDLQSQIDAVFDQLYVIQETLLGEQNLTGKILISSPQQAYLSRVEKKRAHGQDQKELLGIASDFANVLSDLVQKSKKADSTQIGKIQERIKALLKEEEKIPAKVMPKPKPAPVPAPKPKPTPPPVKSKPKPAVPVVVPVAPVVHEEPVIEAVILPEPVLAPVKDVMPSEGSDDDDFEALNLSGVVPTGQGNLLIDKGAGPVTVVDLDDEDGEEDAEPIAPIAEKKVIAPVPVPVIAPVNALPSFVATPALNEEVLERVLAAQNAAGVSLPANIGDAQRQNAVLFAGIQEIPGFQLLDAEQQALFNPEGKEGAQRILAVAAANLVIDVIMGTGIYENSRAVYMLGSLKAEDIVHGLARLIGMHSLNQVIDRNLMAVCGALEKVSRGQLLPELTVKQNELLPHVEETVAAIVALDELYTEQIRFSKEEHRKLMDDLLAFRNERRDDRISLKQRVRRLLAINEDLNARVLERINGDLARMLYLDSDQRGMIADVIKELAEVKAAGTVAAAAETAQSQREASLGTDSIKDELIERLQAIAPYGEIKPVDLLKINDLLSDQKYDLTLRQMLWNVQSARKNIVFKYQIEDFYCELPLRVDVIFLLAQRIFGLQSTYYDHALGRLFYINRELLKKDPQLLGSLLGQESDVLQQELQYGTLEAKLHDQLLEIVTNLLRDNGLSLKLGNRVEGIVMFLEALRDAEMGVGRDLAHDMFPVS